MAFPPRNALSSMPFMGMTNVPPPGLPPLPVNPNLLSGPPPPVVRQGTSLPFFSGPPPTRGSQNHSQNRFNSSHIIQGKSTVHHTLPFDHPSPIPKSQPAGPPITVFVGNITDKWPDAMIRQLLSTCGHVINWKRVQGASGKLQGFGFCEFSGPDSGLRAVRLLHDLEVGDKKLVVKVDAKTNSLLEEYKAERKKKKEKESGGPGAEPNKPSEEGNAVEDYMDSEMKDVDDRAKLRIDNLFREFKSDLDSYLPPGSDKQERDPTTKQAIQDKLHLLKLTSLDAPKSDADATDDAVVEEGKREIISQEITRFREHMKLEKEKEEERKRLTKEKKERDDRGKLRPEYDGLKSPKRRSRSRSPMERFSANNRSPGPRSRSRSRLNDGRRDRRSRDRDRRDRSRDRVPRDFNRVDRNRRRSVSRGRDRSPILTPHKRRYREREEEEEAEEQRKLERKAREKLASYEERLRIWEQREEKKRRDRKREQDRKHQALEEMAKDAKKMKQFLQDYDDEKFDIKYYRGKELQKRLADRARELEMDNKDRQRERDEVEEMRLRLLTTGGAFPTTGTGIIPVITLDKPKKPMLDAPSMASTSHAQLQLGSKRLLSSSTSSSRLQALANLTPTDSVQSNGLSKSIPRPTQIAKTEKPLTSFSGVHFPSSSEKTKSTNPTTPSSLVSPGGAGPPVEMSPSLKSLEKTGFSVSLSNHSSLKEDDTRQSFSSANSPGMGSPGNSYRDDDSLQGMSPDFNKKKKIDVKDVFNQDDDDDGLGSARKRKLVPLDYGEAKLRREEKAADDKKKDVKSLIDRIPTEKDALFAFEMDWNMVDDSLMEKRIRPWINKKIVEYIGEPEPTLVDFICTKVLAKSNPKGILEDVQMVLDEEAEVFVVKMWRLLVFETEAKKIGLASKS